MYRNSDKYFLDVKYVDQTCKHMFLIWHRGPEVLGTRFRFCTGKVKCLMAVLFILVLQKRFGGCTYPRIF
jgi:hypothetical protein